MPATPTTAEPAAAPAADVPARTDTGGEVLREVSQRVLWLSAAIVDAANRGRPNTSGVKVGGHQSSSASMVDIMVALWFHSLRSEDRVSVKPHASPVLHAINYLLGDLDAQYLPTLRAKGGLQSYPSRLKDPDTVDFSTGSVGIGATAALWAAIAHRYTRSHFPDTPDAGRFISLLGDAELDEGAIWEAVADPQVASLGELLWVVDLYAGGQSILVGTPSGVTLAPEGGAHQSITTPSIGLEQPGCTAWEPAFAQDLEWTFLHAATQVGIPGGTSAYFRLSTRPLDPELANTPEDPTLLERRRRQAVAGGYRLSTHPATDDAVTLVGVGALMPEVIEAARVLDEQDATAGVVCLTSPDLVFRSFQQRGNRDTSGTPSAGHIVDELFPAHATAPLVTVQDGHPHTLSFLAGVRGDRIRCLGVTEFGQSSDLTDAYALHGIDVASIVDAALTLTGR